MFGAKKVESHEVVQCGVLYQLGLTHGETGHVFNGTMTEVLLAEVYYNAFPVN